MLAMLSSERFCSLIEKLAENEIEAEVATLGKCLYAVLIMKF